jgi:RNA polymerase sigma factor (sigma-70 family)
VIKVEDIEGRDQALWDSFRQGDAIAYTSLIKKYSNLLYRYGIRLAPDKDFVKDCIQDVFFELWNRREAINSTASVKSYLFKSLRLRIFREKSKWVSSAISEDSYEFIVDFSVETKLIEQQTSEELRIRLANLLNTLPKRQKEILYLRFYEGLDHNRISLIMGLTKQSAYNLLHESISHMKEAWLQQIALVILMLTGCI